MENTKSGKKKILIVHQGAIGDLILSIPAIRALQEHFKTHYFCFMGSPSILEILLGEPVDIFSIQMLGFASLYKDNPDPPESLKKFFRMFEKVIVFGKEGEDCLVRNLKYLGIKEACRIDTFPEDAMHVIDYHCLILSAYNILMKEKRPRILLREEEIRDAEEFLKNKMDSDESLIFIHPGSGSLKKCWPLPFFKELSEMLRCKYKVKIALIEGPVETSYLEDLRKKFSLNTMFIKDISLRTLAALLKKGICYIGNDSGISHLSAAVGIPTVVIFGPTNPLVWAPRGENVEIIYEKLDCSPCTSELMRRCLRQRCLETIKVEKVFEKVEKIITR